jgi:ethanolamine utilization protein EutN
MLLGQVIAEVVATRKHPSHEDLKLLVVAPLDLDGNERGAPVLAVDSVDAGIGDRVLLATDGWAAMTAVDRLRTPIDAAIIGVVDHIELVEGATAGA